VPLHLINFAIVCLGYHSSITSRTNQFKTYFKSIGILITRPQPQISVKRQICEVLPILLTRRGSRRPLPQAGEVMSSSESVLATCVPLALMTMTLKFWHWSHPATSCADTSHFQKSKNPAGPFWLSCGVFCLTLYD
jgi:hypothetical protein